MDDGRRGDGGARLLFDVKTHDVQNKNMVSTIRDRLKPGLKDEIQAKWNIREAVGEFEGKEQTNIADQVGEVVAGDRTYPNR